MRRLVDGRNVLKAADIADVREWLEEVYNCRVVTDEWLKCCRQVGQDAHSILNHEEERTRASGPVR